MSVITARYSRGACSVHENNGKKGKQYFINFDRPKHFSELTLTNND